MSPFHLVTLSPRHPFTLPPFHLVHHFSLGGTQQPLTEKVLLSPFHLVTLSPFHLVSLSPGLVAERPTAESGTRPGCCCSCWIFPGPAGGRIAAECVTRFGCSEVSSRQYHPIELLCWEASCRERHLAQLLRRQQPRVSPGRDAGRVAAESVTRLGCCAANSRDCHPVRLLEG